MNLQIFRIFRFQIWSLAILVAGARLRRWFAMFFATHSNDKKRYSVYHCFNDKNYSVWNRDLDSFWFSGLIFGLSKFLILPLLPQKSTTHFKSVQKWPKNDHLGSLTKVRTKPLKLPQLSQKYTSLQKWSKMSQK